MKYTISTELDFGRQIEKCVWNYRDTIFYDPIPSELTVDCDPSETTVHGRYREPQLIVLTENILYKLQRKGSIYIEQIYSSDEGLEVKFMGIPVATQVFHARREPKILYIRIL